MAADDLAEPLGALTVGGIAGAACFLLCALFLGPLCGVVIAVVSVLIAFARRARDAALMFAAAAIVAAVALLPRMATPGTRWTAATILAALLYGIGLALAARAEARARARAAHP
jgi:hypothetical protein